MTTLPIHVTTTRPSVANATDKIVAAGDILSWFTPRLDRGYDGQTLAEGSGYQTGRRFYNRAGGAPDASLVRRQATSTALRWTNYTTGPALDFPSTANAEVIEVVLPASIMSTGLSLAFIAMSRTNQSRGIQLLGRNAGVDAQRVAISPNYGGMIRADVNAWGANDLATSPNAAALGEIAAGYVHMDFAGRTISMAAGDRAATTTELVSGFAPEIQAPGYFVLSIGRGTFTQIFDGVVFDVLAAPGNIFSNAEMRGAYQDYFTKVWAGATVV